MNLHACTYSNLHVGSLAPYLRERKWLVEEKNVILYMATQICSAMKYLVCQSIIHRDLVSRESELHVFISLKTLSLLLFACSKFSVLESDKLRVHYY